MRVRKNAIVLLLAGLLGLYGCKSPSSDAGSFLKPAVETESELVYQSSMELQYAENFTVDYYEGGYTLLTTTMNGARFLIVPEDKEVPSRYLSISNEQDDPVVMIKRPVKNIYLAASAAMDMFCELDGLDTITFSGQKEEGWYIEAAREAMEKGDILYAGKYSKPDYELIVSKNCTLAIENTMISHSPEVIEKLKDFDIPVMIEYSSYEPHPLGRAEWVKFYGALLGKEETAEKIFKEQTEVLKRMTAEETSAEDLSVQKEPDYAGDVTTKTVAFFFITSNGLIQVRHPSDYVPKMIELAGGSYIFEKLSDFQTRRSTVNMQVEEFYAGAKDADFLIYNSSIDGGISSVAELLDKCEPLMDFKAVQEGNVWCTTNDMYQQSLSVGYFMEDVHAMLQGETEDMHYLFQLK